MIKFSIQTYNIQEWILIASLLFLFSIQLYFIFRYFLKTLFLKPAAESIFENHISVIVSVRNEEENIRSIVEELLEQHYSNFELIVIDDHSVDGTSDELFGLAKEYRQLRHTGVPQDIRFSEKMNINLGMKASRSEWVVFSNPEVKNRNADWLKNMNAYIGDEVDAVVGYSNVESGKGLVRFFFRMEKMWQFLQGSAFTLGGRTFFADQENVLIRKKIYFEKGGFRQHINKYFANLELILNEKIDRKRIRIATKDVAVVSGGNDNDDLSFRNLVRKSIQIRKNLSLSGRLSVLVDEYSRMALIAAFVLLFVTTPPFWEFSFILLFIYLTLILIILGINQRRLKERKIFLSSFAYIFIRPILLLFIGLGMITKDRRNRWM